MLPKHNRSSSLVGKRSRRFEFGEQVGIFRFDGYVGDNPEGQYRWFLCECGNRIAVASSEVCRLKNQTGCIMCRGNKRGKKNETANVTNQSTESA